METRRIGGIGQGPEGVPPMASILSKTAGACEEMMNPLNGLIAWPAQTGEDRILLFAAARGDSGVGSNLDSPPLNRGGRAGFSNCVLPGVSNRPKVS
jgi:hypothetical protein